MYNTGKSGEGVYEYTNNISACIFLHETFRVLIIMSLLLHHFYVTYQEVVVLHNNAQRIS